MSSAMEAPPSCISDPDPLSLTLDDAQRLFDSGCSALRSGDYDQAADSLSRALEIRARHHGELAIECALTYYKYGCALLYKVQTESDALNDPSSLKNSTEPAASSEPVISNGTTDTGQAEETKGEEDDEEGEEDLEEEEESDLDMAWKMLDIARVIYEKQLNHSIEEVDVITALADVSLEREDFEMCFRDYTRALEILEGLVESDNRRIAELCFKLSLAQQLGYKPKDALRYCQQAISVCEARLQRLRNEVAVVKGTSDLKGKSILHSATTGETPQSTDERQNPLLSNTSEAAQETSCLEQEEEIKEIEQLLDELRDKLIELEEMAAAPSLLESLKATNPGAVSSIQQVFSAASSMVSQATSTGGSTLAESSSSFDAPSMPASSAPVTHLGVVGRGVKRATPLCVSSSANGHESTSKKRTLDEMMTRGGVGETQIGFGSSAVAVGGTFSASGQPVNLEPNTDEDIQGKKLTDACAK